MPSANGTTPVAHTVETLSLPFLPFFDFNVPNSIFKILFFSLTIFVQMDRERVHNFTELTDGAIQWQQELVNFPYTLLLRCIGHGTARGAPAFDGRLRRYAADPLVVGLGPFRHKRPHKAGEGNSLCNSKQWQETNWPQWSWLRIEEKSYLCSCRPSRVVYTLERGGRGTLQDHILEREPCRLLLAVLPAPSGNNSSRKESRCLG